MSRLANSENSYTEFCYEPSIATLYKCVYISFLIVCHLFPRKGDRLGIEVIFVCLASFLSFSSSKLYLHLYNHAANAQHMTLNNLVYKHNNIHFEHSIALSIYVFVKPGDARLVLYGCSWATRCLVSSLLALSCIAKNEQLPYVRITVSNADCNCFAQCPRWILYMCKMLKRYAYILTNYEMLNITKTQAMQGNAWPDKIGQDEAAPRQEGFQLFWKILNKWSYNNTFRSTH